MLGRVATWQRSRILLLVLLLFFSVVGAELSYADEESADESDQATGFFGRTMDTTHENIEQNILNQTILFDNFFGGYATESLRQTKYELRLRNSVRIDKKGKVTYGPSLRARLALSKISERLRLYIAGDDEPIPGTKSLPQDPGQPGFDRTTRTTHFASTELRYELIQKPLTNLFLGAGVRLRIPFEAFVRSRFQHTHRFSDVFLVRVGETLFLKNTDLFGETSEFALERLLGADTLIRWANTATASQEIKGLEWGSELSLLKGLSPQSAVTLTGGVYGSTASPARVTNYRLLARYRRNFLRKWLFYELEPELSWPRSPVGSYPATLAFTFRLEIMFQGTAPRIDEAAATSAPAKPE